MDKRHTFVLILKPYRTKTVISPLSVPDGDYWNALRSSVCPSVCLSVRLNLDPAINQKVFHLPS